MATMTIPELQDLFSMAVDVDLEQGVKWLNEAAHKEFSEKYPQLSKALETLFGLETETTEEPPHVQES